MFETKRPLICVQGLGFVGTAMATAVANAKNAEGQLLYNVAGVDLPNEVSQKKIDSINQGMLPLDTVDEKLISAFKSAFDNNNFSATSDVSLYAQAQVVLVDIHLDVDFSLEEPSIAFGGFKSAIRSLGQQVAPECLIIVETTVPPGTCEKVVLPIMEEEFCKRDIKSKPLIAHSYERVMPGADYYESIVNFWRVYSGISTVAADRCEAFLSSVINVNEFPLSRLGSTTASEIGKVLENSYRATNIAFMEEWGRFAESVGVDLFEVVEAIRKRPTHSNMRQPGFGVGGYCLTKDPLFAKLAAKEIFNLKGMDFPYCTESVALNNKMPLVTLSKIEQYFSGNINNKKILMLGVSYRQDVGDTRYSPSEIFVRAALDKGAEVDCHDPLIDYWEEMKVQVEKGQLPDASPYDVILLAVPHREYLSLNYGEWLKNSNAIILDSNAVLTKEQIGNIREKGITVISIGRGN